MDRYTIHVDIISDYWSSNFSTLKLSKQNTTVSENKIAEIYVILFLFLDSCMLELALSSKDLSTGIQVSRNHFDKEYCFKL